MNFPGAILSLLAFLTAAAPTMGQETQRQYLSGHGKDDPIPWRFFCTAGAQSGYWTNLPVPSNWELYGFGTLNYMRDSTNAFDEQGRYQFDFAAPTNWSQRRVFLVFEGAMTDTHAEINGQAAGPDHQGSFYRFKYEITKLLKFDTTNQLTVMVRKHSANESVNRAERGGDYWLFGGIYRPVYLEAVPQEFIERVAIDAQADGALSIDAFANGAANGDTIEAQVFTLDGKPIGATAFVTAAADRSGPSATIKTRIASPKQWTAETPNLYRVEVRLKRGERLLHRMSQRFGFRTMEVRDGDGLYVNGRRVILQGADRHSFWPDSGRCLSEAVHRQDIGLMKEMNMNAVRMSHYPPDAQFLDLCDELGLYVLDELAGWHNCYDTPTGVRLVEAMVTRDANHPSILFWDNGNEGGWNLEVDGEFAKWDPQKRRVLHPWTTFSSVNTAHYLTYDRARIAVEGAPNFRGADGKDAPAASSPAATKFIYMPTEFMHGLYDGGAGAGLEDYWELMRNSKVLGGGFIWALLDEGVRRPDTGEIDVFGNRAPDGILGPYRQKEASFYAIQEIWSPIVATVGQTFQSAGSGDFPVARQNTGLESPVNRQTGKSALHIENRYSFTDANQCRFRWFLWNFSSDPPHQEMSAAARNLMKPFEVSEGTVEVPSIPPGTAGDIKLDLPRYWRQMDALELQVTDPNGRLVSSKVWPLARTNGPALSTKTRRGPKVSAKETADAIEMTAGDLIVRINKQTGMLAGVQRGTQAISLSNGPRPASGSATLTNLESKADGTDYLVSAKFTGDLRSVAWRMHGDGRVDCDYVYTATGSREFYGVAFDYPEQLVRGKTWLGDGPYRVWKNRRRGVTFHLWQNEYNNTITGWRGWDYPEFKGCFSNVRWLSLQTTEGSVNVTPSSGLFVQVLTPEFPPTNLLAKTVVSLPKAGLAFLHAIPPIGDKFHTARDNGPQGQLNEATGEYSGSVTFSFGR